MRTIRGHLKKLSSAMKANTIKKKFERIIRSKKGSARVPVLRVKKSANVSILQIKSTAKIS